MALSLGSQVSVSKVQVGLGNVDNVQQLPMSYLDIDNTLIADSDAKVPSQKAIKAYVDGQDSTLTTSISNVNSALTSHTGDATIHRSINDSGTAATDLWSAQKIGNELDNVSASLSSSIQVPVADITALKAIDTTSMGDKSLINVESKGLYRFDAESTDTGDDDRVVQPTTGSGRWLKMSASINDHNNLSNIQGGATGEYNHVTDDVLAALAGASGTPSSSNTYLTEEKLTLKSFSDISGFDASSCKLDIIKVEGHATLDDGLYISDGSSFTALFTVN